MLPPTECTTPRIKTAWPAAGHEGGHASLACLAVVLIVDATVP
jgi:hypothetical protein